MAFASIIAAKELTVYGGFIVLPIATTYAVSFYKVTHAKLTLSSGPQWYIWKKFIVQYVKRPCVYCMLVQSNIVNIYP